MKTKITKLLDCDFYTEGPVIDAAGNIFFTTNHGKDIIKISQEGVRSTWASGVCPNGQFLLPNGDHLVCDSRDAAVLHFDQNGTLLGKVVDQVLANTAVGVPNDLAVSSAGGLYFTDSIRHHGKVFFKGKNGVGRLLASGMDFPNGIVLSADEKRLYVAESYKNRVLVFELAEDGIVKGSASVFCALPAHPTLGEAGNLPDGMAFDNNGCLWVAHYGMQSIQIISPGGEWLEAIDTGLPLTSNIFLQGGRGIITGGFNEPGPGAVLQIEIDV